MENGKNRVVVALESNGNRIDGALIDKTPIGIAISTATSRTIRFIPWTSIRYVDFVDLSEDDFMARQAGA